MSYSFTTTETVSFTQTHAKHISSKVAADLKRMQRLYGHPNDSEISRYEAELAEFLKEGFLGSVKYGFKRDGDLIEPTLIYTAHELSGHAANDDDPGRVRPGANISGATFYSYLTYSSAWYSASPEARERFKERLPFERGEADEPGVKGYLNKDKTYSAGGRSLDRAYVRSY
jgi:hypothetical protein